MSHRERNELMTYYSLRDFLTILERDSVFCTLCPHSEKTESSNDRAQSVYNQIDQCLTEKGMNY